LPLVAAAIAPSVVLSFSGSRADRTAVSCSKTVLISTVTRTAVSTCPARNRPSGRAGGTSWTNFAPKTVVEAMVTETLPGTRASAPVSMANSRAARPSGRSRMAVIAPTVTPRIFTSASGYITSPARGESTYTATVSANSPRKLCTAPAISSPHRAMATIPASGRRRLSRIVSHLPGQIEVAVGAVDREGDEQGDRDDRDERGAHRVAHRGADPGRAARGVETEEGVDQQHRHRHRQRLHERPHQVDRVEEGREVVVVEPGGLPEQHHRGESAGHERGHHRQ